MSLLKPDSKIKNYRVQSVIKENSFCETYRIVDETEKPYFLKLYNLSATPQKMQTDGSTIEIEACKALSHQNLISYIDSGSMQADGKPCAFLITEYFRGELLVERIVREGHISEDRALLIFQHILAGMRYLHSHNLLHNDITPYNVMLPVEEDELPKLIDLGHISQGGINGSPYFATTDLDVRYCAPETFLGIYNGETDVFSACAVLYAMLAGKSPWITCIDDIEGRAARMSAVREARINPLNWEELDISAPLLAILQKGLALKPSERYQSIKDLQVALGFEIEDSEGGEQPKAEQNITSAAQDKPKAEQPKKRGNGFADIAGMQELKEKLQKRVIFLLQNKEKMEEYKITPPNGMLLYGPPGCGKSFFAEKFAEETGFNFQLVKASDLASPYVHGTQTLIAKLFDEAAATPPTVLCFDEFDAFVPVRGTTEHTQNAAGEVNEFLSQMNNCAERGIFVVGTSNRPDKIDPAVLRTGRIDMQIYVPLPDQQARKEMFALHMNGRPQEEGIDFEKLAEQANGYVASDIKYVVNDAAMIAAFNNVSITQQLLEETIHNIKPSVRPEVIKQYDEMKERMDGISVEQERKRIGFE